MSDCPAVRRYAATPASTATSGRCAGPGWRPIAGVDEAGRGACAGPLVAAAAILPEGKAGIVPGLADSKLLTAKARERCYEQVLRRALAWSVVVIPHEECDRLGMHVANVEALRRSLARLDLRPSYVLTDGFPVDGLEVPGPGDLEGRPGRRLHRGRVGDRQGDPRPDHVRAARAVPGLRLRHAQGLLTDEHAAALDEHGPCPVHRMRFVNVRRAAGIVDPEPLSLEPQLELFEPDPDVELQEVCP